MTKRNDVAKENVQQAATNKPACAGFWSYDKQTSFYNRDKRDEIAKMIDTLTLNNSYSSNHAIVEDQLNAWNDVAKILLKGSLSIEGCTIVKDSNATIPDIADGSSSKRLLRQTTKTRKYTCSPGTYRCIITYALSKNILHVWRTGDIFVKKVMIPSKHVVKV